MVGKICSQKANKKKSPSAASKISVVDDFLELHPLAETMFALFDSTPDTYFFAKDRASRFIHVNRNTLSTYGLNDPAELIGHTDKDFHPQSLADAYVAEDRRVMESGEAVYNQLWLVPHIRGMPRWFVSSKVPLRDSQGKVVGLAGAMFQVSQPAERSQDIATIQPAINYMEQNIDSTVSMNELAKLCDLSSTTFNRHFRNLLHTTPGEYLLALRVETARQLLVTTDTSLANIATDCGFTDQSHFTKRFRRIAGMTPHQYRTQFRS